MALAADAPGQAATRARLAMAVASRLAPARYGAGLVADCRALSAAALARARALEGHSRHARAAIRAARRWLQEGSGDPYDDAEVDLAEAAVAQSEGRGEEALRRLERAVRQFRRVRDPEREGAARRTLAEVRVSLARVRGFARREDGDRGGCDR
jgi:ATP/maltotriose-dependent transcriptional regulator MalT